MFQRVVHKNIWFAFWKAAVTKPISNTNKSEVETALQICSLKNLDADSLSVAKQCNIVQ